MNLIKFEQYVQLLKKEQKDSLRYYTSHEYKELNNKIRKGYVLSSSLKHHFDNILDCFDGGPIVDSVLTVYRGMNKRYTAFENKGIISTSLSKKVAKTFHNGSSCCLYIITLTPGEYTILPLKSVSEMPEEEEILLPPGSLSIQTIIPYINMKNTENVDIVYCTYIPENAKLIDSNQLNRFNEHQFNKVKLELSIDSWVERIVNSGIKNEIETFCDDPMKIKDCIIEQIESLSFYNEIPKEAIDKCILFFDNISEKLKYL